MKVILIHGFFRNDKDMHTMANYLQKQGYDCFTPDLPLTFNEFDVIVTLVEDLLEGVVRSGIGPDEKVHLVGHSTGGLVIRKLLTDTEYLDYIGRCVLIGTPNRGSQLADLASKVRGYVDVFRTVRSLSTGYLDNVEFQNDTGIEIGAIAGDKSNLAFNPFIPGDNDGYIEVDSVYYPGLKDFKVLPYGHRSIHHEEETFKHVDNFFESGQFIH
ncbi:esterase/lipase family protein [Alkalibacillus haloalkaliphilus]|uniref:esterase/lipase family protein n=1 Tax=Alkalibacillus haloalkaliphilus TaxID=94136 RepID=UPI002935A0A0|nr:alpha/beta fold hydrolase [Alkalibacillus haloalkaliphilus]MDV2583014.1 alpha/beta fold hydrolase [Alkalibacillus haloalkaliphilus]